jgi:3alpha(or 20beta)-hydroxysteroid dehydrogenase
MAEGFDFDRKVVLVTGAARGIGAAITRVFMARAPPSSRATSPSRLAAPFRRRGPRARGNLSDRRLLGGGGEGDRCHARPAHVLVNNAGILAFGDLQSKRRAVPPAVRGQRVSAYSRHAGRVPGDERRPRAIVNMSSSSGLMGNNAVGAYGATKWAVRGLTRSAALEYGPHGVRVNGVHPYGIDTWMSNPQGAPRDTLNPGYRNVPLQRMGDPSEVANAVLYLASDAASYTSGAELAVDGATCAGQYFYGLPGAPY